MNYWAGVITGFFSAFCFFIVACLCMGNRLNGIQNDFENLRKEHEKIEAWINDNETVMRTYGFLNENIIKLVEGEKKE